MKKSFSITTIVALSLAVVGIARASLLGVNVTPPVIVYANSGSLTTSYNSGSQIFTVTTTPSTIKFTATEPTFPILTPRSVQIRVQVDNTGALVGGVTGPDLVISGRVARIVGGVTNIYSGLLLTGEVTAFGYQDTGTTVDNYDFRFTPTGGLLQPFFQCDHIGVTLNSEVSTFTGLFTTNFNGQSKGNVGLEDQTPPTITCPFDNINVTNVQCSAQGGQAGAYVTFPDPTATDNCGTNVLITCSPTNGSFFALAPGTNMTSHTVTCVATDPSGNTDSCDFIITIEDVLPPEFNSNPVIDACGEAPISLTTDPGLCTATFTFEKPTAMDSCCTSAVPVGVSAIDENGFIIPLTCFTSNSIKYVTGQFPQSCLGSNVITSTANDGRGNSAQRQCAVLVFDNEPPSITCSNNQTVACTNGPVFYAEPIASDNCTNLTVSCTPPNGSLLAVGSYTVTCIANDGCGGNTNSCSFTLNVVDVTPPTISCPNNVTVECGQPTGPGSTGTATASDDCDFNPSVTFTDSTSGTCPRVISRTWFAVDSSGNTNQCTQLITIQDTTAPTITSAPTGSNLGCNPASLPTDASITALVTAIDNCGTPTINVSHVDSGTACVPIRTFTATASDSCGNPSTPTTVVYTWTADTAAPNVTVPAGSNLGCNPTSLPTDASVKALVTATDNCSTTSVTVTHVDSGTACAPIRTFTVTATDGCNNSSAPQTVIYNWTADTTAPNVTVPAGGNLGCNPSSLPTDASVKALVTATDNCSAPVVSVTHVDSGTACAPIRTFTVNAIDACNNPSAPKTVVYTWTADTAAPVVTVPTGSNLGCNPATLPTDASVKALVTVTDNCSTTSVTVTHVDSGTACAPIRTFTVSATDACNNSATPKTVVYNWTADTTPPTVTVPAGGNLGCNPSPLPTDASVKALVTATDNCSTTSVTVTHVDVTASCITTSTFTVVVKDTCNNTTTKTVVYTYGCPPCMPFEFNFQGNTALSGAVANVRTFITNGVSVKVTAWSRVKSSGAWATAYLGSYAGGLGVTDSSEKDGSNNRHTVDNIDRDNYVLFEFSQPVVLDKAFLGYVVTDSDLKLWIGTFTDPFNNHLTLSDAVLGSFGYTESNMASNNATRWADLNAGGTLGNAIVVAALTGVTETNDQFKIALFDVCKPQCTSLTLGCAASTGTKGVAYSSTLVRSGGTAAFTFSISSGSLPPGLTLNASTGAITGTPTTAGTYSYVAKVTDSGGQTAYTSGCSITIVAPMTLGCVANSGQVGVAYSSAAAVSGGVAPYTFSLYSGSLPPGLTGDPSAGTLYGTPTTAGTYTFVEKVTDSTGATALSSSCTITITAKLTLGCAASTGTKGVAYSSTLVRSGGTAPYTFSISSGSLPPGLTLNATTGAITGTPTATGTYNYTAKVTDSRGATALTSGCCITIAAPSPLTLGCAASTGKKGTAYSSTLVRSGGVAPYTFSISSGSLPPGLTLNTTTGAITGTPTTAATYSYTAKVKDSLGATALSSGCSICISR